MTEEQNQLETMKALLKTAEQGTHLRERCVAVVQDVLGSVRSAYPANAGESDLSEFDKGRLEVAQAVLAALGQTIGDREA